jgi:hypothetical protein
VLQTAATLSTSISTTRSNISPRFDLNNARRLPLSSLSILDVTHALYSETVTQEKVDPGAVHGPGALTHIGE